MKNWKYSLFILLGACSYGIQSSVLKLGIADGFTAGEMVVGQYAFGLLFLALSVTFSTRKKIPVKEKIKLACVGVFVSATSIFYSLAVANASASLAVILLFQFTWIGILLEAVLKRERPSRTKVIAGILLFFGTLLAGGGSYIGDITVRGLLYGILSACSFAVYIYLNSRVSTGTPAMSRSLLMVIGGAVIIFSFFAPQALYNHAFEAGLWKYGLTLGFLGLFLPILCFSISTPKVGAGVASIVSAVELPVAVITAMLILKEHVSLWQWLGVSIILLGIGYSHIKFIGEYAVCWFRKFMYVEK